MFTLNEVTLLGRLGSDAKVRTAAQTAITPKVIPVLIKETAITARKIRRMCSALNKRLSRDRFRMTISSDS